MTRPVTSTTDGSVSETYDFPFSHVGRWGDADRTASSTDYLKISTQPKSAVTVPATASGGCVVNKRMDFDFLYANYGKADNPQAAILSAQGRKIESYIAHTLPNAEEEQSFHFELRFHFVKKSDEADLDLVVPERPSLPIYLPRDVFYPLQLFGAAERRFENRITLLWLYVTWTAFLSWTMTLVS